MSFDLSMTFHVSSGALVYRFYERSSFFSSVAFEYLKACNFALTVYSNGFVVGAVRRVLGLSLESDHLRCGTDGAH